jgi:release factor glutamine methyltransferase
MIRQLSPYEKTHLQRFGKSDIDIADYGETPVEQITGRVEFGGQVFKLNQDVLIPRVESEELINLALEKIASRNNLVVADVGCGSGAIGISLFLKLKKRGVEVELYLSDVSRAALVVTKKNVADLIGQSERLHLIKSDLLKNYPPEVKFDLIIANLPYIPSERISVLDESVREYEPHLALDGGSDGLKYIKQLITQAKDRLSSEGIILMEVDHTHDRDFLAQNLPLKGLRLQVGRDQFQRTRFVILSVEK